jgi:hypothetical protein
MQPTPFETRKCAEILPIIEDHVPLRGYIDDVQALFKEKGLPVPNKSRIMNVRAGKIADYEIVKALVEISRPRDEFGEVINPHEYLREQLKKRKEFFDSKKKPQNLPQTKIFAEAG